MAVSSLATPTPIQRGLTKVASASFSGAASVSIDNCFSATYTHYIVKRNLLGSSALANIAMRLRVSSTDTVTDYRRQILSAGSTVVSGVREVTQTSWAAALGYTEATTFGYSETWISNPFEAVRTTAWNDHGYDQTGSVYVEAQVMAQDGATSFTGLTAIPSSGTITGTISVYGLVKS
jgi:hypothetical protein